jgi:nicotinate phosphoribosyltransferase
MLEAAIADGTADKECAFEAFARKNPAGRWGIMAGIGRLVGALNDFVFTGDQLEYLSSFLRPETLDYLEKFTFSGRVTAFPDGELWLAGEPLISVQGSFAQCVVIETVVLSILNSSIGVASAAARIRQLVGADTTLIEMGSRRIHEIGAVDMARAAAIGGFDATSNLEAGFTHGIETAGTAAHAWIMAHEDEYDSFVRQLETLGVGTTLLVDTYDITRGIERAVAAANSLDASGPGAIRIDSGDLAVEARRGRDLLDSLGATNTRILLSSDLDYDSISALVSDGVPADAYGVGTRLAAAAPPGIVYKLVEIEDAGVMRHVVKLSATPGKSCFGGRRRVGRHYDDGRGVYDIVGFADEELDDTVDLRRVVFDGHAMELGIEPVAVAKERRGRSVESWDGEGAPRFSERLGATMAQGRQ